MFLSIEHIMYLLIVLPYSYTTPPSFPPIFLPLGQKEDLVKDLTQKFCAFDISECCPTIWGFLNALLTHIIPGAYVGLCNAKSALLWGILHSVILVI